MQDRTGRHHPAREEGGKPIEQNTAFSVLSYRLAGCPVLNSKRKAESARALVRHGLTGGLLCRTCERFSDGTCESFLRLQQQKPG